MVSKFNNFIDSYHIYKSGEYSFSEYSDLKKDMISFPLDFLDFKIQEFTTLKQNIEIYKSFLNFSKENLNEFSFNYMIIPVEYNFNLSLDSIVSDDFNIPKLYVMKHKINFSKNSELDKVFVFDDIKIFCIKTYIQEINSYEYYLVLENMNEAKLLKADIENFDEYLL